LQPPQPILERHDAELNRQMVSFRFVE